MTQAQWDRVGELFTAALQEATGKREAWLEAACPDDAVVRAEVLSLLRSDQSVGSSGFVGKHMAPALASLVQGAQPPARVGPYRLVRELGQGGMGTVYLAERDDDQYRTQVAVKLVRRGYDTDLILNRFYRERQTLARLQHPHIARLLDGGTTPEGLPFIVMEYIDGTRITDYCRERGLSVAQRLTLFLNVCKAADYAHRHFVVHRDIKPGNILVDQSGDVKLVDFGICKLLQSDPAEMDQTLEAGLRPLTPDYASPEQIRGDPITVGSDIYSLAAVLYELLTGAKPHKIENHSIQAIERGICDTEVVRPSAAAASKAVARQLEGDLDTILLYALQKDPRRRYGSVEQFSEDIRRHLAHQPVMARPDTFGYRAGKFLRRRSGSVAAAAAVLLALSAGVVLSLRSARIAQENLGLVRQLSNTFVFDVYDSVRDLPGATKARQLIVKTGLQYLDNLSRNAGGDAELQRELAAAYRRIGDVQGDVMNANLGNTGDALASYTKALALLEPVLRADPLNRRAAVEQLTLHLRIGGIRSYTQDPAQTLASYRQAEQLAEALRARFPDEQEINRQLANIYNGMGDVTRRQADYAGARAEYTKALTLLTPYEQSHADDREAMRALAVAYAGIGNSEARLGRLKESLAAHRQATTRLLKLTALEPANANYQRELMITYSHTGDVLGNPNLRNLGDTAGAMEAYGRMTDVARRLHEADPADQRGWSDYGIALARVAAVMPAAPAGERIRVLQQAISLLREAVRMNSSNLLIRGELAFSHNFLGDAYQTAGDTENALRAYREGLSMTDELQKLGSATVVTASLMMCRKLGELTGKRGDREAAGQYAQRALQLADAESAEAKRRPPQLQAVLETRAYAAAGAVHAALAGSPRRLPADRSQARAWLEKSLAMYRALEKNPKFAFAELHRREMRTVENLLAVMR